MSETWEIILKALGGYTVVLGGLFWWLGKRKLQSILAHEKGEIQKGVNRDNSAVLTKHQKELEELKEKIAAASSIREMLAGSFSNSQSQVFEKRIECIEALWAAVFALRDTLPSFLTYVDIILEEEYEQWVQRTDVQELFGDLSMEKIILISKSVSGNIERVRPFVGEYLWSLFFVYRAFLFRVVVFVFMEKQKEHPKYWKNDDGVMKILSSVLSESDLKEFKSKEVGSIQYAKTLIENAFLSQVDKIMSGKVSIQEGAEHAKDIMLSAQRESA